MSCGFLFANTAKTTPVKQKDHPDERKPLSNMVLNIHRNHKVKPVLNWANVCSPNIFQTVRRTMIHFLIELLVRRTWFGQFDELYFILNWLIMRCKLRPKLAADVQQTA